MKIGVFVEGNRQQGGGFTHQLNVLKLLRNNIGTADDLLIFCLDADTERASKSEGLKTIAIRNNFWLKIRRFLVRQQWTFRLSSKPVFSNLLQSPVELIFKQYEIDIVFFPGPSVVALELTVLNYIFTVWDLCHLEQPEFPEVRSARDFELREELYERALKKAVFVITDSEFGKALVTRKYQLEPHRVVALPFLPSPYATNFIEKPGRREEIFLKYKIAQPYIFYPAQFWAHKNHVYLLKALDFLRERHGLEIQAVFAGVDKGNKQLVLDKAVTLGVADLVNCIGFADDDEMPYLFQGALALTMPTYFGPTNIPPLDAFALGCPVCYSDLPAFREQLGNAAFFVDLESPESLANILFSLHQQPGFAEKQINLGVKHTKEWNEQRFVEKLTMLFTSFEKKLESWR